VQTGARHSGYAHRKARGNTAMTDEEIKQPATQGAATAATHQEGAATQGAATAATHQEGAATQGAVDKKVKKKVVVPSVHIVTGVNKTVTPENRPIQRVLVPVDHRAEYAHQERGRVVPLMRMEAPADEPERPLMRFSPPPDAPKGRMPAISRMPGRMPRTRLI